MDARDYNHILPKNLNVRVCTFNVGNAEPCASLEPWIPSRGIVGDSQIDVLAVGLQECAYKATDGGGEDTLHLTSQSFHFVEKVASTLGDQYIKVETSFLMQMRLAVFVRKDHRRAIQQIEKSQEATGIAHVGGNKGGLVVSLSLYNTSLCFVSCHLAAHEAEKFLERRNSDCAEIMAGARVGIKELDLSCQYHHAFWFGDLNYRIDMSIVDGQSREKEEHFMAVAQIVRKQDWQSLIEADQLRHQMKNHKVLVDWSEEQPSFPPTFKVLRKHHLQYIDKRTPSYCDRILFKSLPGRQRNLKCNQYHSVCEIDSSDHKPVFCDFGIQVPKSVKLTDTPMMQLSCSDFQGLDLRSMDYNGTSDPYIRFFSEPADALAGKGRTNSLMSKVQKYTLSPMWKDGDLPSLPLFVANRAMLARCHIIMAVYDKDLTSADDPMGQVVVSLAELSRYDTFQFDEDVLLHGQPAGTLRGSLTIVAGADTTTTDSGGAPCGGAAAAAAEYDNFAMNQPFSISMLVKDIAKRVKGSKKMVTWVFTFGSGSNSRRFMLTLVHSVVSGKKIITLDRGSARGANLVHGSQQKRMGYWEHVFGLEQHELRVVIKHHSVKGKRQHNLQQYDLYIDSLPFRELPRGSAPEKGEQVKVMSLNAFVGQDQGDQEKTLEHLKEILPSYADSVLLTALKAHNYRVDATVDALLSSSSSSTTTSRPILSQSGSAGRQSASRRASFTPASLARIAAQPQVQQLKELFPNHSDLQLVQALSDASGSVDEASDALFDIEPELTDQPPPVQAPIESLIDLLDSAPAAVPAPAMVDPFSSAHLVAPTTAGVADPFGAMSLGAADPFALPAAASSATPPLVDPFDSPFAVSTTASSESFDAMPTTAPASVHSSIPIAPHAQQSIFMLASPNSRPQPETATTGKTATAEAFVDSNPFNTLT